MHRNKRAWRGASFGTENSTDFGYGGRRPCYSSVSIEVAVRSVDLMILSKPSLESPTLISIQSLRGIAALLVAWSHISRDFVFKFGVPEFPITYFAPAGVDLFFII